MTGLIIAYLMGFVTGALLAGMAWRHERRRVRELEAMLKLSLGQIASHIPRRTL